MNLLPLATSPPVGWFMVERDERVDVCPDCRGEGVEVYESPRWSRDTEVTYFVSGVGACGPCEGKGWLTVADVFRTYDPADFGLRRDAEGLYWRKA